MSNWTNELRIAFDALCQMPVMEAALAELERRCQVKKPSQPIAPGYDEIKLAAFQYHHAIGQREVLDHIAEMRKELPTPHKPLPPPNTAEALARKQHHTTD